jgi:hypothetical protein
LSENYVHEDSYATASSHFGKTQTTLLTATVYFNNGRGIERQYFDFVSSYLSHNDYFYGQAFEVLVTHLLEELELDIDKIINITDGGKHFVSRYAFWYNNLYCRQFGKRYLIYYF